MILGALGKLAECNEPLFDVIQRGKERKSVTDTDLITAGESNEGDDMPQAVTTNNPDGKSPASAGSLSTMVLPELRALANQAGVKGTSGMRKNELIAAIQEVRGRTNGSSTVTAPAAPDHAETDQATDHKATDHKADANGSAT